jgi:hypothetical protein
MAAQKAPVEFAPMDPTVPLRVVSVFAYATAKGGEVVQLVRGDIITDRFTQQSIDHLRSIGFVAESE